MSKYKRATMIIITLISVALEEVLAMEEVTLDEVLEQSGLTAKWEARGRAEGRIEGRAEGETEGEARERRRFIEQLKSGKSLEEILKLYEVAE
jgi:predicted transposase YdaD